MHLNPDFENKKGSNQHYGRDFQTKSIDESGNGLLMNLELLVHGSVRATDGLKIKDARGLGDNVQCSFFEVKFLIGFKHLGRIGDARHKFRHLNAKAE